MQPETEVSFDAKTFERLKKSIRLKAEVRRMIKQNPASALSIPEELGIQLTYRCNLRCKHCFQWSTEGHFLKIPKLKRNRDLDTEIVFKLLHQTKENKASLYIWGGEPLYHSDFGDIARYLENDKRLIVLCSNGLLIEEKLDSILRISSHFTLLLSLDGFELEHDSLRGQGNFQRLLKNINLILTLQRSREYKGEISLNCVISEAMIPRLYELLEFAENMQINTMYLCFPWYISKEKAKQMDLYYNEHLSWLNTFDKNQEPSWYSYSYHIHPDKQNAIQNEIRRINDRKWKIRVRLQPALEDNEIGNFLCSTGRPAQGRKKCMSISNRMDILADGNVTACKCFPEMTIGNLSNKDIKDIWHSKRFQKVRKKLRENLMPVCPQCILLYLNGI